MDWQRLRHAVVSAMLLTIALLILSSEEKLMMVDSLLKSIPDGKLTVFKSGLFGGRNIWLSELKVLTLQVSVLLVV